MALPSTYQKVEWIQGTGSQYINTGFAPNQNSKAEFKISNLIPDSGSHNIFGEDKGWSNSGFTIYYGTYGGTEGMYCFGSSGEGAGGGIANGNEHECSFSKNGLFVDGTLVKGPWSYTFTGLNLYLFALNRNGSASEYSNTGRIHYIKLYDNGTLVRNFVPCYRKSDSVIGMYDLVNNTFYTNAGTGTFTKGPNVRPRPAGEHEMLNAYIGEDIWTPGSNTIAYYPLTSTTTVNDQSGNNRNLTNSGVTFGTYQGVNCAYANTTAKLYNTSFVTNQQSVTIMQRFYYIWNNSSGNGNYNQFIWRRGPSSGENYGAYGDNLNSPGNLVCSPGGFGGYRMTSNSGWHHCAITYDYTNKVGKMYVDGTFIGQNTNANPPSGSQIWIAGKDSNHGWNGGISEFVVEGKVWTDAEILDYYNQTKSNYGL